MLSNLSPEKKQNRKFRLANWFEKIRLESGQRVTQDLVEPVLLKPTRKRGVSMKSHIECVSIKQTDEVATISSIDQVTRFTAERQTIQ
ncbi:hypothetical protein B0O99DRAFT_23778 [Bisporella sp. PMI_857]|nr:hypothetical protein B0O99DRAFT_23778 [Bisporella sp. PMI_857]